MAGAQQPAQGHDHRQHVRHRDLADVDDPCPGDLLPSFAVPVQLLESHQLNRPTGSTCYEFNAGAAFQGDRLRALEVSRVAHDSAR